MKTKIPFEKTKETKLSFKYRNLVRKRRATMKEASVLLLVVCVIVLLTGAIFIGSRGSGKSGTSGDGPGVPKDTGVPGEVHLTFLGNSMLGEYADRSGQHGDIDTALSHITPLWEDSAYVFTNLDTTVIANDELVPPPVNKTAVSYVVSSESVDRIVDNGINVFAYANYHSLDFGVEAYYSALGYFDSKDISYAGLIDRSQYTASYYYHDREMTGYVPYTRFIVGGKRIAFISVSEAFNEDAEVSGMLTTAYTGLYRITADAVADCDLVIVYICWPETSMTTVSERQRELATSFIDAGADIVIGCGAQAVRPVEKYLDGYIFYSLGNFLTSSSVLLNNTGAAVLYDESADGTRQLKVVPIHVNNGMPEVTNSSMYTNWLFQILTGDLPEDCYTIENDILILKY